MFVYRVPQALKKLLGRHLLTVVALAAFLFVGLSVDQVRELIIDVFAVGGVIRWMTFALAGWGAVLIGYFLLLSPDETVVDRTLRKVPIAVRRLLRYPFRVFVVAPTQVLYWIASLGRRFSGTGWAVFVNFTLAGLGLCLAMSCPLSPSLLSSIDSVWPLTGGFIRMLGLFAAMVALWLGLGTWVGPDRVLDGPDHTEETGEAAEAVQRRVRVWRRTGEVLSILLVSALLLELVWVAVESSDAFDMSVYTVWAFLVVGFTGTLLAALVDFLYRNTYWPWRLIVCLVLGLAASLTSHVDLGPTDVPDVVEQLRSVEPVDWVEASLRRLRNEPEGPVIIVTASGGGSRAALVAALSLEIVEDEFRQDGQHPACVWLGSGVSGGGLALAAHYYPSDWELSTQDAVTRDYLGPIFRGFLTPFSNRGESLTAYWDRAFPWQSIDQTSLDPGKPLLAFGVADVDTGRRVIVGFPRLPKDWFSRWRLKQTAEGERWTLSDKDHEPYSLSTLQAGGTQPNVRLTRAVRMSSSFPFGFEPTRIAAEVPEPNNGSNDQIHFLDGGMVDNTGVDSVLAILSKIETTETPSCQQLARELRRRGIFLVEIDAGAGSGDVAESGLLSRVTQPFGGYNRGVYAAAKRARDRNVAELSTQYGEDFTTEPIESYPASDDVTEVMTTLALPEHDVRRLIASFENPQRERIIREALRKRYAELLDRESVPTPDASLR
ncbi:patatin-like phospholipase family protein [Rhodopirellula europaea]|uniref:patatin-like phospholipase family protein n=1 Tax=Rhodopirellula europaea TaxID=1263866 RepID=UPI003D2B2663